jgi:divalent metal cation (Fe/Co/Zn/Cd) transporter
MFNKIDIDGGSREQAARKDCNEFGNVAHGSTSPRNSQTPIAQIRVEKFHGAIILTQMISVPQIPTQDTVLRVQRIQAVTIVWMSVEAAVSLFAAWRAHSPALLAFGGDSAIELFSAVVVLRRFRSTDAHEDVEKRAARVAGALLFALAAFVVVTSLTSLLGYSEPKPTFLGIAILVAAAAVMPWLAKEKRRLSGATGSPALRADAAQSALCAYLSLIGLAGLAINAIWRVKWADPIAGLVVLPLIGWEGWEAMRGKHCGCC